MHTQIPFARAHAHMLTMCTLAFDHSKVTSEVNVSELVMLQMCLAQRLSLNPDDHEAEQQLREVELKVKCVCWLEEYSRRVISTSYHMATRALANLSPEGAKRPRAIN